MTSLPLKVILLSRGWSRRYPGDKALAPTSSGGAPLLARLVSQLRRTGAPVNIILYTLLPSKCGEYRRVAPIECLPDPPEARDRGPGALIWSALRKWGPPLLALPIDLPEFTLEALHPLLTGKATHPTNACPRIMATGDRLQVLIQYHPRFFTREEEQAAKYLAQLPRPMRATDLIRASRCVEIVTAPPHLWRHYCHLQSPGAAQCPGAPSPSLAPLVAPGLASIISGQGLGRGTLLKEARIWASLGLSLLAQHAVKDAGLAGTQVFSRGRQDS